MNEPAQPIISIPKKFPDHPMKIIFAGTPEFAATALEALLVAGHDIALVLTQPDRPAGRGMQLRESAVKQVALQYGLALLQPATLRAPEIQQQLCDVAGDVMIVAAYGLILPTEVLRTPRFGCINIHASLLPRWRGAAPIQRALLAGDRETGITIMQMDEGLDTGAMLLKQALPIGADDSAQTLHDKLVVLGAQTILSALTQLAGGGLHAQPQDESLATYAAKLTKDEARLDWQQDAQVLARAVRAFNPFPVAQTSVNGEVWRIWRATAIMDVSASAGTVVRADKSGVLVP